ncbi:MAG: acyltransferase [Cyanothece sp. SIO2G6]|nr:acyltransferase [Cyanothece sp. SIO2G6]
MKDFLGSKLYLTSSLNFFFGEALRYFTNYIVNQVPSHCFRLFYYRNILNFKVGRNSFIFMSTYFDRRDNFSIGDNSVINQKCRIDNRAKVTIGSNVSISPEVYILTADHDLQCPFFSGRKRPVLIGDYVFIGTRALILPGVSLGVGSAVAAGAVVTKDVPPYSIVAGIPAKFVKSRNSKLNYKINYGRPFS